MESVLAMLAETFSSFRILALQGMRICQVVSTDPSAALHARQAEQLQT